MFNPLESWRKFQSRIGKPIRPVVEFQKEGSIINIVTTTVQDGNIIHDTYRSEGWELHPTDKASAIYVDGLFKGMGYAVGEEGTVLKIKKEVTLFNEVLDENENPIYDDDGKGNKIPRWINISHLNISYKGLISKLLDANLYERGSALKASFGEKLIWAFMGLLVGAMLVMSYGHK
jgi:hypothetical protein